MKSNLAGKFTWEVSQVAGGSEKFDFSKKSNFFFFLPTRHTSATLTATDPDRIVQRKKSPMHLYTGQVIEAPLLPGPAEVKKFAARSGYCRREVLPQTGGNLSLSCNLSDYQPGQNRRPDRALCREWRRVTATGEVYGA